MATVESMAAVELPVEDLVVLRRRRSVKWQTYPADVLPLWVAEMDFSLAAPIRAALHDATDRSDTGYSMVGDQLGTALAGFAARTWQWRLDPARVVPVPDVGIGAVELLRAMCEPGDVVAVSTPVYAPFFSWIAESRTRLIDAPLRQNPDGAWRLDLDAIELVFRQGPTAYLLCNPANPAGTVPTASELAGLVDLAYRYGVSIISDEIHAPLVLPGAQFTPLLTVPGAGDVAVALVSASKAWNLAGLKCALLVSTAAMQPVVDRLPPDGRWRIGHFGALATVAAYDTGADWLTALLRTLDLRRRQLTDLLATCLPEVSWTAPPATYLAWLDCRAVGAGDEPQARFLAGGVALEPGPRYGALGDGHVRLNFATSEQILTLAVERMAATLRR